jgi:signal transduction histidine kinase
MLQGQEGLLRSGAHVIATLARPLRILLIEDSELDANLLTRRLSKAPWPSYVERVESSESMSAALARESWDLVICDYSLPQFNALQALAVVRESGLDLPFIILSGTVGEEAAAEAMRAGAHDVVLKDNAGRLIPTIERELAEANIRRDLRASQAALARSEQLSAIGQMAAGIAHDLINILNPLSLHLHAVEQVVKRERSELRESVSEMNTIVRFGLEVVQRLRTFSRGEQVELTPVALDPLVHDAVQLARSRAAALQKAIRLHEQLGGPTISVRPDEIVAAVVNLVVNAIEAIPAGGNVWVSSEPHGSGAVIEVRDDGPGIPDDIAERVFDAFFTTKGNDGTGLGLAMVRATAERHGGRVEVESAPGSGTAFRVFLPNAPVNEPSMALAGEGA